MNDEQFELAMLGLDDIGLSDGAVQLRARDTAQREALAQLQAEMPDIRANMTKALDLLQVLTSTKYTYLAFVEAVDEANEMLEQLRGKVVLKGQAEQQEAQEIGPLKGEFAEVAEQAIREQYGLEEAQGAQAGDERIALLERELDRERERADMAEVELQHARAALATQPAKWSCLNEWFLSLEPGRQAVLRDDKWMLAGAAFEAGQATQPAAGEPVRVVAELGEELSPSNLVGNRIDRMLTIGTRLYTALPAARHGDEAVAVVGTVPDGSGFKSLDFKVDLQDLPDGIRLYAMGPEGAPT